MIKYIENHSTQRTSGDITACFHVWKKWFSVQSRFEGSNCLAPCDYAQVSPRAEEELLYVEMMQWGTMKQDLQMTLFCAKHCVACFTRVRSSISFIPNALKIFPWSEYTHPMRHLMRDFVQQRMGFIQFLPIDFVTSDSSLECPVLCL